MLICISLSIGNFGDFKFILLSPVLVLNYAKEKIYMIAPLKLYYLYQILNVIILADFKESS